MAEWANQRQEALKLTYTVQGANGSWNIPDRRLGPLSEETKMTEKIRILFLSANPWTTSRILVDEEAREIFEKLQEGTHRDRFELYKHAAIRPIDLQRLLMMYEPHIVHFSGHGSKTQQIILGGAPGRGKEVDSQGLVEVFALYKNHLRLVLLNACFTRTQARSLSEVIDYSVGTGKGIGDRGGVAFAGAFYRALGFGKSVKEAFESAKAELGLTKMPRTKGIELFVRNGISKNDAFPQTQATRDSKAADPWTPIAKYLLADGLSDYEVSPHGSALFHKDVVLVQTEERSESQTSVFESSSISRTNKRIRSEAERYTCLDAPGDAFSMRARPVSSALALMSPGREIFLSELKSSRLVKRVKRANPSPTKDKAEPRPTQPYARVYVAVIVKFHTVLIEGAPDVSQTQSRVKNKSVAPARALRKHNLVRRAPPIRLLIRRAEGIYPGCQRLGNTDERSRRKFGER